VGLLLNQNITLSYSLGNEAKVTEDKRITNYVRCQVLKAASMKMILVGHCAV
jgi:hypothetical protein